MRPTKFENAVKKVLWALEPLPSGEQRVLALKEALNRLRKAKKKPQPKADIPLK